MKPILKLASLSLLALSTSFAVTATPLHETVKSDVRSDKNKARDEFRNPQQTLNFFGLKQDMTVVEIWPGGGWYMEILAPTLKDNGVYYAAGFPQGTEVEYFNRNLKKFDKKLKSSDAFSKVKVSQFNPREVLEIAPAGSADMVLTFRNLHNFYMNNDMKGLEVAFNSFHKALKKGGILGIVDHRLPENLDQETNKRSGYLKQSIVVKAAEKAGFKLEASSEVNANPLDTAQHPKGVWTLPPVLRAEEKQQAKYRAIGESDRMTLKFIKK